MATQPLPPNAIDAEKAVLGALLIDADMRYRVAGIVQPGDFYLKRHEHIYRAMLGLNGSGLDLLTVSDALEAAGHLDECGGQSYLSELVDACAWSANAEQYAAIVAERAQRRRLVTAAQAITLKAYDLDSPDPLSLAHRLIMDIPARQNGGGLVGMNEAVGVLYDQVEAWARDPLDFGEVRGLATEIPSLDHLLGGLQPGWLVLICARPMIGKSALAFEIARRNAEKARRVAIFSLEMPRNDILLRWASCLSGVETRKVRRGPCPEKYAGTSSASAYLTDHELAVYLQAMDKIARYPSLWIDDTGALSALDIRARAIRLAHQAGGLDLIIVDHSGLMIGDGQNGEGVSKVEGRKSNAMRALAKEIGCPVILIQQLNRASEARNDKHPSLSDLRDSGEHEQNAHVVIGLYRESAYKQMLPGTTDDLSLEALTLKHREGPSGKRVTLRYERNLHRFGEFVKGVNQ